jgi:hypothetical protein
MNLDEEFRTMVNPTEQKTRQVVRLTTSCWHDGRALHIRKTLKTLKRQSSGHNFLDEDASMIGADEVLSRIVNLHKCEDGVYVVSICNEHKDWETGNIEDYDYELLPMTHSTQV